MHVDMPRPVSLFELYLFKAKMVYALVEFGLADGCVGITLATASHFSGFTQQKSMLQTLSRSAWMFLDFSIWW